MDKLPRFLEIHPEQVLGRLTSGLAKEGFDTTTLTTFSWIDEITELHEAVSRLVEFLPDAAGWTILFEYTLPIIGQRIDCVILADDLIYVIEYKGGTSVSAHIALEQAQEYAMNLADFHEASKNSTAIPLAVGTFKTSIARGKISQFTGAAIPASELARTIIETYGSPHSGRTRLDPDAWDKSRYFPVPTIIQAASAIYRNHNVTDLANSRAGIDNLEITQEAVAAIVQSARLKAEKRLIVLTGVPGAGKTLAGLNVVQRLSQSLDPEYEQASFLSGNGPLVKVIQTALKRSVGKPARGVGRSVQSRVREIHRFVRDSYGDVRAPADRLIVFDEAQRAWTAAKNLKKFGRDRSEPEMILEIMARHRGWAVVVALVGGGQEIHAGEAGLAAWGDAIAKHPEWRVTTSPEAINGGPSVAGSRLYRDPTSVTTIDCQPALHLNVSKRSFDSEVTAAWANALLDGRADEAKRLSAKGLRVYLTREIHEARCWLLANTRGSRRAGLIASSGASRLRADGVEAPTFNFLKGIDYVRWFLDPAADYRSSNQLEVAMSEFEMQGLELDLAGLLWGGDLVFPAGRVVARRLRGRAWCAVGGTGDPQASAADPQTRIQNKYRVLLTRFRKQMVIFVPPGRENDPTYSSSDFDDVQAYLLSCGVQPLLQM